jgi:peptide-methionine (R)-S-oxide reductase
MRQGQPSEFEDSQVPIPSPAEACDDRSAAVKVQGASPAFEPDGAGEMYNRRRLLGGIGSVVGAALVLRFAQASPAFAAERFEITHSDAQWRTLLGSERYAVLRQEATEPPGSSPLDHEKRRGTFVCAGCDLPLFKSDTKFESGTGWPSFYAPIRGAVAARADRSLGMVRTEVHCRRCGGHLGHVFDDGPPPTGKRYCMNGLALKFEPA